MSSKRPSSARPVPARRTGSGERGTRKRDETFLYDCKAAYLVVFDELSDNIRSKEKLMQVLQQAGRNPSRKAMEKNWKPKTDYLTFEDFVDICEQIPITTKDELMKAFKKIDINGDGFISSDELFKVMTTRGEKMNRKEVQAIIDEVDENGDGKLDYKEFCKMMLSTQEESMKLAKKKLERKQTKKSEAPPREKTKSPRNDSMGSQTSLGSQTRNEVKKNIQVNGTAKKEETKQESTTDDDDDIVMGSQVSIRATKKDPTPRKVVGAEKADLRSEVSARSKTDLKGSQVSLRSPTKSGGAKEKDPLGSQASLKSTKSSEKSSDNSSSTTTSNFEESPRSPPKPKPRKTQLEREDSTEWKGETSKTSVITKDKPPISSLKCKLSEPRRLKDWNLVHSKGAFFFEEDDGSIVSHIYRLDVPKDTSVWITIEPFSIRPGGDFNSARELGTSGPVDTMLFLMKDDNLIAYTDQRDSKGKYCLQCDLKKGKYTLLPYTTGCRFRKRTSEPKVETKLVKKDRDDKFVLTKAFKEALSDIFDVCDLDGNGLMNREEFNWFNIRTSGEEIADEEWEVVEENVELKNGELTRAGFQELNQMEAEDNQGDTDDLWVTLSNMGYNKGLVVDEAVPFVIEAFTECRDSRLKVVALEAGGNQAEQAVCDVAINNGDQMRIKNMKDLFLYTYITDFQAWYIVDNQSKSRVTLRLDCSRSKNTVSNQGDLDYTLEIPARTAMVGHHLLPQSERDKWTVNCAEAVIK